MRSTALFVLLLPILATAKAAFAQADAVTRGRYIFHAGACDSCHTNHADYGPFLAGGRPMETPFGTFFVPNITPAQKTGIGNWTFEDFRRAMVQGKTPDGNHYYPVFPYRWYTGMTEEDLSDLWAYLQSVPPVENQVPPHELPFPFNIRFLLLGWKLVNFDRGETVFDTEQSEAWNRGAYIVNHLGHCGACHTTKLFGMLFRPDKFLAGSEAIPGPYFAPNITPHKVVGIGNWTTEDVVRALKQSIAPDGVPIRGPMAEYVAFGSSRLSAEDLEAVAVYLRTIKPETGPVAEPEERLDRRLVQEDEAQSATEGAPGGGGMGSAGTGLLRLSEGGRTRAK